MANGSDAGFIVKVAISIVAIIFFLIPEAASSAMGLAALGGIWGLPLLEGD